MRIGFFGTPSLASSVLQDLIDTSDIEVVFVVTNPDKSVGRSSELQFTPVKILATTYDIPVFTPVRIRENIELLDQLRSYDCDYFIVVAYGKILPVSLLEIPRKMCINVHGSILPAHRGASPIQSALLNSEKETGVTIMEMSEGMDEGNILKIRTLSINSTETSFSLFGKFSEISGATLIQTLRELEAGGITPLPQDHSRATYCKKIEKEDGLIQWTDSAVSIYHKWQAYTPWPGIYTIYEGKRLLLEQVSVYRHREEGNIVEGRGDPCFGNQDMECFRPSQLRCYGERVVPRNDNNAALVIRLEDGTIGVVCGEGILTLEQVKLEGKKSQNIKDFVNGNQKFISSHL